MVKVWTAALAAVVAGIVISACGGSGGTGSNGGSTGTCGPDFALPNYARANDPVDDDPNLLLYWDAFPVSVWIDNEIVRSFGGTDYSTTDHVWEALSRWADASGDDAEFVAATSRAAADIIVSFEEIGSRPGAGGTLGMTTTTYYIPEGIIDNARIRLNVWPNMTQAEFTQGLVNTTTHEFGHALFLSGHSDSADDVMYFQGRTTVDMPLSLRDTNTFITAYCGDFGSTRSAKPSGPTRTVVHTMHHDATCTIDH